VKAWPDQRASVRRHPRSGIGGVAKAIREDGGYALMPEWGTQSANYYLPRRKTKLKIIRTSWSARTIRSKSTANCPTGKGCRRL